MKSSSPPHRHELPDREVFALPKGSIQPRHLLYNLRQIANEFKITKRKQFYHVAWELSAKYYIDRIIEDDLRNSTEARLSFIRIINIGVTFGEDFNKLFQSRPRFSLWNEAYFTCEGDLKEIALSFKRDEFLEQLGYAIVLTVYALSTLPRPSSSRKKNLALREWTSGHLEFWVNDLGKTVTSIHDKRDGYSPCHRWLRALLTEIDPSSLRSLGHILREQKAELREKSAPE